MKLGADGFFDALLTLPTARCLDFMHIAAGVYAVDRICKRKVERGNDHGIRQLAVTFAVDDLSYWKQRAEVRSLVEVLSFLTGDDWTIDFSPAKRSSGDVGHLDFLSLPRPFQPKYAALYSGGLDSAAGLANRLLAGANEFILMTVSHQSGLHSRVDLQLEQLKSILKQSRGLEISLLHSTLTTSLSGGKSKRLRMQEQTQRCRAFLFFACAAVAANAYGVERIEVFENGVGAINLPLMTGMLGSGLCTRGAHPTFLRWMSELASRVMERAVRFELPFAAKTKAELISGMSEPSLGDWALQSRSCVHTSPREAGRTHCGRCAACIERRQAFAAAGIAEDAGAYQMDIFTQPLVDRKYADYFDLYREDAVDWLANSPRVRRRLNNHLRITEVPAHEDDGIVELQMRNAREAVGVFHHRPDGGIAIDSATQ
jgi:7-cyano-7-deazaguanine synthase in queuosine biosynthesis